MQKQPINQTNKATSYLLWAGFFFQLNGLHRLYNGKIGTGLLWLCTFGLFGIGQIVDLFLITNMVEEHNQKVRSKLGLSPDGVPLAPGTTNASVYTPPNAQKNWQNRHSTNQSISQEQLMIELAKIAQKHGGKLSVTQAVIETGISFEQIETALRAMLQKGYVAVNNHPENGMVIYEFLELS